MMEFQETSCKQCLPYLYMRACMAVELPIPLQLLAVSSMNSILILSLLLI